MDSRCTPASATTPPARSRVNDPTVWNIGRYDDQSGEAMEVGVGCNASGGSIYAITSFDEDGDASLPARLFASGDNTPAFQAFVQQIFARTLRSNDLVVLDNLSSHNGSHVAALIPEAKADLVHLPPYSPDINPIEPAFSRTKQAFRSLAARTVNAQWQATQDILDSITSHDAKGYFRHCGYQTQQD